jgi:hypothetical protein
MLEAVLQPFRELGFIVGGFLAYVTFILGFILFVAIAIAIWLILKIRNRTALVILLALSLPGCTTLTEISDSSGCMYSTGGPIPGMPSGIVVVCRSGRDNASISYRDQDGREIRITHR